MTQLKPLFFALLLALAELGGAAGTWTLVWADNGDGAANTPPNSALWRHDTGGWGWGNNELQSYTNRVQNSRYDGAGNLVLEARAEAYTGADGIARNYTSARLLTSATFTQTFGRFEARMRLPYGQGIWPAFWMLGNDIGAVGWPACGEIDVMEMVGYEPNRVFGTLHGPGYSGGAGIAANRDHGSSVSNAFHEFAVEWEPNVIRWTMDGVHWLTRTPGDLPGGAAWVFQHPHFMLLNLAVGGNWPGAPDGTTVFPQFLTVDYVRVYARDTVQAPYGASPHPVPGTIQAEAFDHGGPGVSHNDSTLYHPGGVNRPRFSEQADLEACTDAGGGEDLGWTAAGEWLEYTVDVAAAGDYALTARLAGMDPGGTFRFELDGTPLAGSTFTVPNTGGWQTWATVGPQTVTLPAGQHVLRLAYLTNGSGGGCGNLNWFRFESLVTPTPVLTPSSTRSPTRTATRSATRTPSPTPSATLTATRTATPSGTPSATPSRSASPTLTGTPSASATPSEVPSLSASPSQGPSPLPGSPSATPSLTATLTRTAAPSGTPSATPSPTRTPSPSLTATASGTRTRTATSSATASTTAAAASPSPTPASTGTATPTLSPSPAPAASAVATTVATVGAGRQQVWALYNPQRGPRLRFRVESSGLSQARLRCYSPSMALAAEADLGALGPGWHAASLPAEGLAPGLYWVRLSQAGDPLGKPIHVLLLPD